MSDDESRPDPDDAAAGAGGSRSPDDSGSPDEAAGESSPAEELYAFRDAPPSWHDPRPLTTVEPPHREGRPGGLSATTTLTDSTVMPVARPMRRRGANRQRGDLLVLMGCNMLVFVTSVCIMVLELTATRLIAKHVGNSLYTWTSVIGVVLAGITIGNYLGGWLADRFPPRKLLSWLFLAGSLTSFAVLWLDPLVAGLERPADWDWSNWVLINVAMIYLAPAVAMGTISPVVASLALSRSTQVGITVGSVYAWGAFGSIIGTFLTGFLLIDLFGTKAIVGMTAGTLAILGVLIAAGQWAFRAAVVLGWMQLMAVVLAAACVTTDTPVLGGELGAGLHQLGLALRLRDDVPGEYHDESRYSYIHVGDTFESGDPVRFLVLDKLPHSYYNPERPTALYYQYEQIYAAVTERAIAARERTVSQRLPSFSGRASLLAELPEWVRFDADHGHLVLSRGLLPEERQHLLALSAAGDYWMAVETLQRATRAPGWPGYGGVPLKQLPEGVEIPAELTSRVHYDRFLQQLVAHEALTDEDVTKLIDASAQADWYRAINGLFHQSRQVSTLFIGGGGFIFPRWIEAYFPHRPVIDVAELDPAVKQAVQAEMGLPPDSQTAIRTHLEDARKFVDERLRENDRRRAAGEQPLRYDLIYGDAFNDFSVPWHLTTREFSEKVRRLLTDDGLYLVNIIDTFPRTEYPPAARVESITTGEGTDSTGGADTSAGSGDEERQGFRAPLPDAILPEAADSLFWESAPAPFSTLELLELEEGEYLLGYRGRMTGEMQQNLEQLEPNNHAFITAVQSMAKRSRSRKAGRFLGRYVRTAATVFPHVYVFSSDNGMIASAQRDTYVIVCSLRPLRLNDLEFVDRSLISRDAAEADLPATDGWWGSPFAWSTTDAETGTQTHHGLMPSLLQLSDGHLLTDDYAPVDNLLAPVFEEQDQ